MHAPAAGLLPADPALACLPAADISSGLALLPERVPGFRLALGMSLGMADFMPSRIACC